MSILDSFSSYGNCTGYDQNDIKPSKVAVNKMRMSLTIPYFSIYLSWAIAVGDDCHFARSYNKIDLLTNSTMKEEFLLKTSWWQGVFGRDGIGIMYNTAMTAAAIGIDHHTGIPIATTLWDYGTTTAQHEAWHLGLLALAWDGNKYALEYFGSSKWKNWDTKEYIVDQLKKKLQLYQQAEREYPGFGGFLSESFTVQYGKIEYSCCKQREISAISSGYWCWALIAVAQVLRENANLTDLAIGYEKLISLLAKNAIPMFIQDPLTSKTTILERTVVLNVTASVSYDNYATTADCILINGQCPLLDEAGNPFYLFLFLYCNWTEFGGVRMKNFVFINRPRFDLTVLRQPMNVTVERHTFFSSEEVAKYLLLPYFDIPQLEQVYLNGERARTLFSAYHQYPGLFAETVNYTVGDDFEIEAQQWVHPGIWKISAISQNDSNDIIAAYAAFPLLLHWRSRGVGIVWLASMLNNSRTQTTIGVIGAIKTTGDLIARNINWQANGLLMLGICGGLGNLTRRYLTKTKQYDLFYKMTKMDAEDLVGQRRLKGMDIPFALPSSDLPNKGPEFLCNAAQRGMQCDFIMISQRCLLLRNAIEMLVNLVGLILVIGILYIGIFKITTKNMVHRWFTVHVFSLHFIQLFTGIILFGYTFYQQVVTDWDNPSDFFSAFRAYTQKFYIPQCITLIMSVTIFSIVSAIAIPTYFKRFFKDALKWHIYMALCHLVAFGSTISIFPRAYANTANFILQQYAFYDYYIIAFFYAVLCANAIYAWFVITKRRKAISQQPHYSPNEMQALISMLTYAITPTIWCFGSQVAYLGAGIRHAFNIGTVQSGYRLFEALDTVQILFRGSYAIVHTIATVIGLRPYRAVVLGWMKKNGL